MITIMVRQGFEDRKVELALKVLLEIKDLLEVLRDPQVLLVLKDHPGLMA
jgi:hypothetical protein